MTAHPLGIALASLALLLVTGASDLPADPLNGTWSQLTPSDPMPSARSWGVGIYDPNGKRFVTYGGASLLSDTWALALDGGPAWTNLAPAGFPQGNQEGTAVYDAPRQRMLVYGGRNYDLFPCCMALYSLSMTGAPTWTTVPTAGTPANNNFLHAAIYDPVRERMLIFGGRVWGGLNVGSNAVWEVTLTGTPTWNQLAPIGTPPPGRISPTAIYDPMGDRMLVFGGRDYTPTYFNDVWALNLSGPPAWSLITPSGTPPPARWGHVAIYDPVRERMVIYGGYNPSGFLGDVWQLNLSGSPEWSQLSPDGTGPPARAQTIGVYDSQADRMIIFSGAPGTGALNDAWALTWGTPLAVPPPAQWVGLDFAPTHPNPANQSVAFDFKIPTAGRVHLDILDLGGRLVRTLVAEELRAGPHSVVWNRATASGGHAVPAVYMARLRFGAQERTRPLVLLP